MPRWIRTAGKIVLACVALLIVGVLIFLLPAHWQIRHVEPPLPSASQLRALLHQPDGPSSIRYLNTSEQKTAAGTLTHSVFIIEWPSGERVMIDSGMTAEGAREFGAAIATFVDAAPAQVHGTVASILGRDVGRIMAVGYTHLHSDHTGGTAEFCRARGGEVRLLQTQWQTQQHNFTTRTGAATVRDSCLKRTALREGPVQSSAGFPGLGIVALGGHTPDSTLFAVPVGDTLYLLSGDITNTKAEIRDDVAKAWLYSHLLVPEHVPRNAILRHWLADLMAQPDMRVVVSHDLEDIRASGIQPIGTH